MLGKRYELAARRWISSGGSNIWDCDYNQQSLFSHKAKVRETWVVSHGVRLPFSDSLTSILPREFRLISTSLDLFPWSHTQSSVWHKKTCSQVLGMGMWTTLGVITLSPTGARREAYAHQSLWPFGSRGSSPVESPCDGSAVWGGSHITWVSSWTLAKMTERWTVESGLRMEHRNKDGERASIPR